MSNAFCEQALSQNSVSGHQALLPSQMWVPKWEKGKAPTLPCWEACALPNFCRAKLLQSCVWVHVGDLAPSPACAGTQGWQLPRGSMSCVLLQLPRGLSLLTLDPTVVLCLMCDPLALLELFEAASSGWASPWRCFLSSSDGDKGLWEQVGSHSDLLEPRGKTFH